MKEQMKLNEEQKFQIALIMEKDGNRLQAFSIVRNLMPSENLNEIKNIVDDIAEEYNVAPIK